MKNQINTVLSSSNSFQKVKVNDKNENEKQSDSILNRSRKYFSVEVFSNSLVGAPKNSNIIDNCKVCMFINMILFLSNF